VTRFSSVNKSLEATDQFIYRHVGTQGIEKQQMLEKVGFNTLEELISATVPDSIRLINDLKLDDPLSETEALAKLKEIVSQNKVFKSLIGMGYYDTKVPQVIQRNVSFVFTISLLYYSYIQCHYNL
jgi:glycine dehydrogenase